MDDDPALMTPLDRVVLEQASRTIRHHVKMETVLPFNAWIEEENENEVDGVWSGFEGCVFAETKIPFSASQISSSE